MRSSAYCTASSYNIKSLFSAWKDQYNVTLYRDVIHLSIPLENGNGDLFCFPYGCVVCWGLSGELEKRFLQELREFSIQHFNAIEIDEFNFVYGDTSKINRDNIILHNHETETKLALSHALAQSVRLASFETAIQEKYDSTKHIPTAMAEHGKISLSSREIRRKMGELFIARSSINLQLDVLDTPEYFWERPELEPLYMLVANDLEIETRLEVLNQRLDVVQELLQMLGDELKHQHASRLEWTIIWLIIIEVILSLYGMYLMHISP